MAPLLFEYFYESECVSEEALNDWLKNPNQAESEGKSMTMGDVPYTLLFSRTFGGGNVDERLLRVARPSGRGVRKLTFLLSDR